MNARRGNGNYDTRGYVNQPGVFALLVVDGIYREEKRKKKTRENALSIRKANIAIRTERGRERKEEEERKGIKPRRSYGGRRRKRRRRRSHERRESLAGGGQWPLHRLTMKSDGVL